MTSTRFPSPDQLRNLWAVAAEAGNDLLAGQLVSMGALTEEAVDRARHDGERWAERLVESGALPLEALVAALSELRRVDLDTVARSRQECLPQDAATAFGLPDRRFGKYVLVERIGEGGFGEVWKAWDRPIERWVAIKLLKHGGDRDRERFLREARMGGRLTHPAIVAVHEVGEEAGRDYIATELVDGVALGEEALAPAEAARIVRDAARAAAYAHRMGVLHRDLKPSNLILARDGSVHLCDFGLARPSDAVSSLTATGEMLATPAYAPPEQIEGRADEVDARCDVYALGATLYHLLTGRAPYEGDSVANVVYRIEHHDPPLPSRSVPLTPRDLDAVCQRAMERSRSHRYPDADALADDLDRFLAGTPVSARLPGPLVRLVRRLRSRPAQWWIPLALGGSVLAIAFVASTRPPDPRGGGPTTRTTARLELTGLTAAAAVQVRPIDADDLSIGSPIPLPADGRLRVGEYVIEVRGVDWVTVRLSVRLEHDTTMTVPLISMERVPDGMVLVPEGPALFGGETATPEERHLPAFLIDRHEVTRAEFHRFLVDDGGSPTPPAPGDEDLPAAGVTWEQANRFAQWAGKRLPSPEEWEKAARGVDGRPYPWGRLPSAEATNVETTAPSRVGSFPRDEGPFGCLDMAGNVAEWTSSAWPGVAGGRVVKGNSFQHQHAAAGVDLDHLARRAMEVEGASHPFLGFRCAMDVPR